MENSNTNLNKKNDMTLSNDTKLDAYDIKINELQLQLEKNQKNINNIKLRTLATIENMQKQTNQQIEEAKIIEKEMFFNKIFSIIDSIEDMLLFSKTKNLQDQPVIQGISLTLKSLLNTICSFGVKIEGYENEMFDTNIHHAASKEKSLTVKPNHIISVQKKGFTFNKMLLRKAIVTVSEI